MDGPQVHGPRLDDIVIVNDVVTKTTCVATTVAARPTVLTLGTSQMYTVIAVLKLEGPGGRFLATEDKGS